MAKDKALGEKGDYWARRMRLYEQDRARKNAKITAEIDVAFSKASSDIKKDLEYWYGQLAKNNGISLVAARRMLDAGELAEFKWSVDEYMAKARQSGNGKWLKELENASARVHISRLDAMKISMRNTLESAFVTENSIVTKMAGETYRDAVQHTAAEMEKLFKAEFNIAEIDDEKIRKLIRKPWTPDARTFSDRILAKKNEMINSLQEELTRGCIYGQSLDETIARMEKFVDGKFKNAKYAARRIVVTESAYFRVLGTRDELAELGVKEFQVDLPIDKDSCEICRSMNGRVFPLSEFAVGLNAPPFHPNCENGGIIPVMDEDFKAALGEAREKKSDDGLTNDADGDIIKENSKKAITPITDEAIEQVPNVSIPGYSSEQCEFIQQQHKELLKHARKNNENKEVAFVFRNDLSDKDVYLGSDDRIEFGTGLVGKGNGLVILHNHPRNSSFSDRDIRLLLEHDTVKTLSIVKNSGGIEVLTKTEKFSLDKAKIVLRRSYKKFVKNNTNAEIDKALADFLKKYKEGLEWIKK